MEEVELNPSLIDTKAILFLPYHVPSLKNDLNQRFIVSHTQYYVKTNNTCTHKNSLHFLSGRKSLLGKSGTIKHTFQY